MILFVTLNMFSNAFKRKIYLWNYNGKFLRKYQTDKLKVFKKVIWDKVFKSEPSKFCGRQPLKNLKGCGLLKHLFFILFRFAEAATTGVL